MRPGRASTARLFSESEEEAEEESLIEEETEPEPEVDDPPASSFSIPAKGETTLRFYKKQGNKIYLFVSY